MVLSVDLPTINLAKHITTMTIIKPALPSTDESIERWIEKLQSARETDDIISLVNNQILDLQIIWRLMDLVWDEMGCDNINLDAEKISTFYQHPIWLLNGFFIEQHELSLQHRHAISDWIVKNKLQKVLDFGGGFGTIARIIADKSAQANIDIYEPYPSEVAISKCKNYSQLKFTNELSSGYDCLISTDVLEHVSDPLDLFAQMIAAVKVGGYLLIANHFYPSIKCHLPITFHFRYSFDQFARAMGLEQIGNCQGSHATIYRKIGIDSLNWQQLRMMELISRLLFPWREFKVRHLLPWRYRFKLLLTDPSEMLGRVRRKFIR